MIIPKGEKIGLSINGEVIVLDIRKDFSLKDGIEAAPVEFAYLVALKGRLFKLLKERELEKDKYYYSQFMILKEDGLLDPPRSNEWVKAEIYEDEHFLSLLESYNQTLISYNIIVDVIKAMENKIGIARSIMADKRMEKNTEY